VIHRRVKLPSDLFFFIDHHERSRWLSSRGMRSTFLADEHAVVERAGNLDGRAVKKR